MSEPTQPDDPVAAEADSQEEAAPTKSATTILAQEISISTDQLGRSARGLLLSSISGGLDIGFGPVMMVTVVALAGATEDPWTRLLMAAFYSLGFVIVILGRSELFTEHTTLAVYPLLSGRATFKRLARLWGLVYTGNIVGTVLFSIGAVSVGVSMNLFTAGDLEYFASSLTRAGWVTMLGSAVAAGWMMGLMSWLVTAARDTIGQIAIIMLVTGAIGWLGLHHSIAGTVEVLLGVFGGDTSWLSFLRFLVLATVGNAVGGVVFVAALKYGHGTQPGHPEESTSP